MRTLDLTPVLTAMRDRPGDFEMDGGWLRHRASNHSFLVLAGKLAQIEARCSCAQLEAEPRQAEQLVVVHSEWIQAHWRPLQVELAAERRAATINRQFTAHFRRPNRLARLRRRLVDACEAAWQALTRADPEPLTIDLSATDQGEPACADSNVARPKQHADAR